MSSLKREIATRLGIHEDNVTKMEFQDTGMGSDIVALISTDVFYTNPTMFSMPRDDYQRLLETDDE